MIVSDYRCNHCHNEFEAPRETETYPSCPGCGGDTRRIYSLGGIAFKGTGFYKTDK